MSNFNYDPSNSPSQASLPTAVAISAGRKAMGRAAADASTAELADAGKSALTRLAVGSSVLILAGVGMGEVSTQLAFHQADKATAKTEHFNESFIPTPQPNVPLVAGKDAQGNITFTQKTQ
jgi:hypothetical protein